MRATERTGQRYYEPELHRLRGELVLAAAGRTPSARATREAEEAFRAALAITERQQSSWLELRAATSLARLLHRQGQRDEARRLVERACRAAGGAPDTPDAAAADALRRELTRPGTTRRAR
jgi:hypothetical protein